MIRFAVLAFSVVLAPAAVADDARARANYTLHCQGCHLADATGLASEVPRMKDFVGYFLHSDDGRRFLIRVPGVATSSLPDDELTEMMNWLLVNFSATELPPSFSPYSVAEVAALRADIEPAPQSARVQILADIAERVPALAEPDSR